MLDAVLIHTGVSTLCDCTTIGAPTTHPEGGETDMAFVVWTVWDMMNHLGSTLVEEMLVN